MIDFKEIPRMIKVLNTPYLRVHDRDDNLLFSICDAKGTTEKTCAKLETFKNIIKSYNCIYITAATQKQYDGNFRGCYRWEVLVNEVNEKKRGEEPVQQSSEVQKLSIQLETLKLTHKFEEKMRLLEEKYETKKPKEGFNIMPWIPLAGKFFGLDKTEIAEYMQMAGGNMEQEQTQLSGKEKTELSNTMTGEEMNEREQKVLALTTELLVHLKHDKMIDLLTILNPLVKKVGIDKVLKMIDYLNTNPSSVNTLLALIP